MFLRQKRLENNVEKGEKTVSPCYGPTSKDGGHIVLPLSVSPSVCLHKLNMKTQHFPLIPN